MSTRGWYEYYIIDAEVKTMSLAMQFYKWGNAMPKDAMDEWHFLNTYIQDKNQKLPIILLDDMLREQLGVLYAQLPEHFAIGVFLFFLQRAREEACSYPPAKLKYRDMPKESRPDYRLGFEIGKAKVRNGFPDYQHSDPYLESVLFFITNGHLVRQWKNYGLRFSILEWLQYLTQITWDGGMRSIAADFRAPFDIAYIYRFFIWKTPSHVFEIDKLALEICNKQGINLIREFTQNAPNEIEDEEFEYQQKILAMIATSKVNLFLLDAGLEKFTQVQDNFWKSSAYEHPPLIS
jgi:hypothetical protein